MLAFGIEIQTDQIADNAVTTPKIADNAVTNAKSADMAQSTIKGRAAGAGTGDPTDLSVAQVKTILGYASSEITYDNTISGLLATNVKTAIDELDSRLDALGNGMVFSGTFDAGGGAGPVNFPGGGTAQAGAFYQVTNAAAGGTTVGTSNAIVVNTGDQLVAAVDNASTTNGADWVKLDNTDSVVSVAGKVGAVTLEAADIINQPTDTLVGRDAAGTGANTSIGVTGGIEFSGSNQIRTGAFTGDVTKAAGGTALTIAADAVDNTKLANMAQGLIKGRASGAGTGDPTDLTGSQVKTILGQFQTADIGDDQVTFAKMQEIATDRLMGRDTAGTGNPEEIAVSGGIEFTGGGAIQTSAFTGDATKAAGGTALTLVQASQAFAFTGDISPTQITAQQDNYNPSGLSTASVLRLTTNASQNITGLQGGADGRVLFIHNVGSNPIVLVDESGSSTAANRFALNANRTLLADEVVLIQYDSTTQRWRESGARTITLTGDVTGSGNGSFAATIAADAVTFAKMQNIGTDKLIGRDTAATGDPEEIGVTGGIEFTGSGAIQTGAFTGDATKAAGGTALTVVGTSGAFGYTGVISPSSIGSNQHDYNPTGLSGASVLRLTASTIVTISGLQGGASGRIMFIHNVGSNAIILLDESAGSSAANRFSFGGATRAISTDEVVTLMYDSTSSRWRDIASQTTNIAGDASGVSSGASTFITISADAVSNTKLANMAQSTIKGRSAGSGTGDPEDLTVAQARTVLQLNWTDTISVNTGTVTTGTPFYATGGSGTANIGVVPGAAIHMKRCHINFTTAIATTSGSVTVVVTVYKNANSGSSNRVFQSTFTSVTTGVGRMATTTTIVDSGADAFNGISDYYVIHVDVTASTSCSLVAFKVLLEGTYD